MERNLRELKTRRLMSLSLHNGAGFTPATSGMKLISDVHEQATFAFLTTSMRNSQARWHQCSDAAYSQ